MAKNEKKTPSAQERVNSLSEHRLRGEAARAASELAWIRNKHGEALAPGLVEKLGRLEREIREARKARDIERLRELCAEALECLENEAAAFRKSGVREVVEIVVLAVAIAVVFRTFVVQLYGIPSRSMVPTILVGDYVLVTKLSFGIKNPFGGWVASWDEPERGEVIVFSSVEEKDRPLFRRTNLIKRVIAVGGDEVAVRGGRVFVNGEPIDDPWRAPPGPHDMVRNYGPATVPEHAFFVMGDNRNASRDSRYWGFVPMTHVIGKARFIYYSAEEGSLFSPRWDRIGNTFP